MFYEVKKNVPVPADVSNDTRRGKTKYPFAKLQPIDPNTRRGDCIEVTGDKEAQRAIIRMRGYAREHKTVHLIAMQERTARGKIKAVRIFRAA